MTAVAMGSASCTSGRGCASTQPRASPTRALSPVAAARRSSCCIASPLPGCSASQRCVQASASAGSPSWSNDRASRPHHTPRGSTVVMARSMAAAATLSGVASVMADNVARARAPPGSASHACSAVRRASSAAAEPSPHRSRRPA